MRDTEFLFSFSATDANGKIYTLDVMQDVQTISLRSGQQRVRGLKSILCNGEHVNRIDAGIYETLWGTRLTSDDPNAP